MNNWFKIAKVGNENQVKEQVKHVLRSHPFFVQLMNDYHIPPQELDKSLVIEFANLHGLYAEGNGEKIILDHRLLDSDFFRDNFHFVVHEFFHWVKRKSEEIFYFNDSEEVQSFVLAIAWELINGKPIQEVSQRIFPIVSGHYRDPNKAKDVFSKMVSEAEDLAQIYARKGGELQ